MRANGITYSDIHEATHLYRSKSSYATMFTNETYLGILKCGDLRVEGGLEALVDKETWEVVQAQRQSYAHRLKTPRKHPGRTHSPYLLSGLAVCGHSDCGAAMIGGTDNVKRGCPWPFYLCGRKNREGWNSCPTGKVNARILEQAVLDAVIQRVLTPEYVLTLVKEVNAALTLDDSDIDRDINRMRQQLAGVEKMIGNLLDLAERYGAEAAGDRLLVRETEREELVQRLRRLERKRELRKLQVDPEVIKAVLTGMRGTLKGDDLQAKRILLKRFVERVEVSRESAWLVYTFPVPGTALDVVSQCGYSIERGIEVDLAAGGKAPGRAP